MKHLQGSWTITALETDGNQIPAAMLGESKIIVKGSRFTTVSMGAEYGGNLTVDETVVPHRLDLHFTNGPHQGLVSPGIYKLDGDNWTICLGFAGYERPTSFVTTAGSGHALETLTRDTPANAVANKATKKTATTKVKSTKPAIAAESSISTTQTLEAGERFPDEMKKLGGEWTGESIVSNGQPLPAQYLTTARRSANGHEMTVTVGGQIQLHAGFAVDPTTTPRSLNYFDLKKPGKPLTMLGIYELRGDTLTTCFAPKGQPRPQEFASPKGGGLTLTVWKRSAS